MNWSLVKNIDGKWWLMNDLGNKERPLTDEECVEYIWGGEQAAIAAAEKAE